ncbi:PREDICTED: ABSCISIC ACID-INSENSITIVE 5-like protein 2 [Tarenaya hassleriana]|uniref:ABSCISIC ACID-INSENSITIVE 5-like protein 2 n=1 Tax=Tarenaya hassleriana TaxID=28532 RepID=UPI00053C5D26|nr:PREDICTED: ABSCISIC ACID-INSENSITIVE 5-like protein 2 [Tarenaya hassleriana]
MVMGSLRGTGEEPKSQTLPRQGSLYSLTLDEVQTHLGESGRPLGSMNLDELLKSVWSAEANQSSSAMPVNGAGHGLSRQGSLTLPGELSKKTVDEVWREIQQNKNGGSAHERKDKQPTLGEMTLEDLLLKAGVVTETIPGSDSGGNGLGQNIPQQGPWVQYHQLPSMPQPQAFMPYPVSEMQAMVSPLMGGLSDTQAPGRKRVASGDVAEKTVERRQKRMIKNRESAARSRARKQAYTHELEIKISRLEEENERLRREKEVEKVLPTAPPPDPKRQLRRTSSASF